MTAPRKKQNDKGLTWLAAEARSRKHPHLFQSFQEKMKALVARLAHGVIFCDGPIELRLRREKSITARGVENDENAACQPGTLKGARELESIALPHRIQVATGRVIVFRNNSSAAAVYRESGELFS